MPVVWTSHKKNTVNPTKNVPDVSGKQELMNFPPVLHMVNFGRNL